MEVTIRNIEQMTEFVRFFSKSSIEFTPKNDDFINLLYKAISSGSILPTWLSSQIFQDYVEEMIQMYPEDTTLKRYIKGYTTSDAEDMLEPTEYFKTFCGPEGLTQDGRLSKKMALNFIMYQIGLRSVKVIDGTIYMNDYLNSLFKTNLYKIRNDELIDLIDTLFI
jgi:hypothetical protein